MPTLIIIEDDPFFRMSLVEDLEMNGYNCHQITRGDTAVEKAKAIIASCNVDLIVADGWFLPGKRGTDVVRELRSLVAFNSVPIIIVSVEYEDVIRRELIGIAVDAVMKKPVLLGDLIQSVGKLLTKSS